MNYLKYTIEVPSNETAEILIAFLSEYPFDGFEQRDGSLTAFIPGDEYEINRSAVEELIRNYGLPLKVTPVAEENWNQRWESNFDPVRVGDKLMVRAPFHDADPDVGHEIVIMPRMSFGTGHHQTTWLMLDYITGNRFDGQRGLDMGCGTAVLAIAACIFGAEAVDAVDIDRWSVDNSLDNITDNAMSDRISVYEGDIAAVPGTAYDFVFANINRNVLLADMERYYNITAPDGRLLLSGFIEQDIDAVTACAVENGFLPEKQNIRDGWAMLVFRKGK